MIKTILVPTDFSENALAAFRYALAIKKKFNCKIILAHAYLPFHSGFISEKANEEYEMQALKEVEIAMEEFRQSLLKTVPDDRIKAIFFKGTLGDAISEWINKEIPDLIVMGTNGATRLKYKLLGSQTLTVSLTATVPVLAVPFDTQNFKLDHITFFTNYHEEDVHTLKQLKKLFGTAESECTLVHIYEQDGIPLNEEQQKLNEWTTMLAKKAGMKDLSSSLVHGEESAALVEEISDSSHTDLLVLTLAEKSFFEKLLSKSLAKIIIQQPKTPVLLVKAHT